jgi:hypothetical protein
LEHIKEFKEIIVSSKNVINLTTVILGINPSQVMDEGTAE